MGDLVSPRPLGTVIEVDLSLPTDPRLGMAVEAGAPRASMVAITAAGSAALERSPPGLRWELVACWLAKLFWLHPGPR
jgi:hypothetical protein